MFGRRTFCIKISLFFHDTGIEHFGDPDSIADNAAFSLVCKFINNYCIPPKWLFCNYFVMLWATFHIFCRFLKTTNSGNKELMKVLGY